MVFGRDEGFNVWTEESDWRSNSRLYISTSRPWDPLHLQKLHGTKWGEKIVMYVRLESICQEAVTAYCKVLSAIRLETPIKTTASDRIPIVSSEIWIRYLFNMLAVLVSELISFFLLDSLGTMFKKLLFYSFQQNIIILLSQKNRVTAKKNNVLLHYLETRVASNTMHWGHICSCCPSLRYYILWNVSFF